MTEEQALEQFEKEAEAVFNLRQTLPKELFDMVHGWVIKFAEYGNRKQLQPTEAACAVASFMALIAHTHAECALAEGKSYDDAINQMLHYLDIAARVELGLMLVKQRKAPLH